MPCSERRRCAAIGATHDRTARVVAPARLQSATAAPQVALPGVSCGDAGVAAGTSGARRGRHRRGCRWDLRRQACLSRPMLSDKVVSRPPPPVDCRYDLVSRLPTVERRNQRLNNRRRAVHLRARHPRLRGSAPRGCATGRARTSRPRRGWMFISVGTRWKIAAGKFNPRGRCRPGCRPRINRNSTVPAYISPTSSCNPASWFIGCDSRRLRVGDGGARRSREPR